MDCRLEQEPPGGRARPEKICCLREHGAGLAGQEIEPATLRSTTQKNGEVEITFLRRPHHSRLLVGVSIRPVQLASPELEPSSVTCSLDDKAVELAESFTA